MQLPAEYLGRHFWIFIALFRIASISFFDKWEIFKRIKVAKITNWYNINYPCEGLYNYIKGILVKKIELDLALIVFGAYNFFSALLKYLISFLIINFLFYFLIFFSVFLKVLFVWLVLAPKNNSICDFIIS